jgi:uncharacterized SAM-binding protein YcdF (DUF218 family)
MGRFAMTLGLLQSAVVEDGLAQSTLQNALFSLPLIPNAEHIIVVTEAFHLPRSWASFRWAAWELDHPATSVTLVMSEDVRCDPHTGDVRWNILIRESLAIRFNLARALAYSMGLNDPVDWLH